MFFIFSRFVVIILYYYFEIAQILCHVFLVVVYFSGFRCYLLSLINSDKSK